MTILGALRKAAVEERLPRVLRGLEELMADENVASRERELSLDYEYDHIQSAVKYARMLARKRGIDPDLAAVAAAVHNIGRIVTGKREGHAEAGYLPAKIFLRQTGLFTPEEIEQIAQAVRCHSSKGTGGSRLEEPVKDVDVFDRYCAGLELTRQHDLARLARIRRELNF